MIQTLSVQNLSKCHLVYHKSYLGQSWIEPTHHAETPATDGLQERCFHGEVPAKVSVLPR